MNMKIAKATQALNFSFKSIVTAVALSGACLTAIAVPTHSVQAQAYQFSRVEIDGNLRVSDSTIQQRLPSHRSLFAVVLVRAHLGRRIQPTTHHEKG